MVAIRGHFDGRVIVPDEPLDLPAGQPVMIRIEPVEAEAEKMGPSALEWAEKNAVDDPNNPPDLSYQHDQYLYGTPKKKP